MAAFGSGIRWADMSTESFSRSKTAPGTTASAALLLQAEQADHSYAPGEAVVLPEFENSQAGMNQYFLAAAVLGEDSSRNGVANSQGTNPAQVACSDKSASDKSDPKEQEGPPSKMPGFRGLLEGSPADGTHTAAAADDQACRRRERNAAAGMLDFVMLTPAKRNRRTSGAPLAGSGGALQNPEGPAQDRSASAAPDGPSQRLPQNKRRKSGHSRRSLDSQVPEQSFSSTNTVIVSSGQHGKRRPAKGVVRRKSGGTRRASEGPANPALLLQMGAPSFLQLPGLVSPMFMPVGMAPGAPAALPGLLHPQVVQQQQAKVNSSREQQEQEDEEEWHRRECARLKDIAIGKATAGYRNFLKQVGTEHRSDGDPVTPDAKLRCSKAQFQRAYQKWRKQLHQYDTLEDEAATSKSPAKERAATSAASTAGDDPGNMIPKASADQQDVEAILAFNKECELAGL